MRTVNEIKRLRDYKITRFRSTLELSFNQSLIYYLTDGDPGKIKSMRQAKERDVLDYYYINRVNDLNSLLDHIAYIKHIRTKE